MTDPTRRHHANASSRIKKRKPEATECSISRLPDDMLGVIFCKLPIGMLLNDCRYVCKSWGAILLDPDFGNLYLSLKEPSTLFLCMKDYTTLHWLEFQGEQCFFNPVANFIKKYQFVNSCNGLLYLREYRSRNPYFDDLVMYILNPVTGEYMCVPPAEVGRDLETGLSGLGFSPQTNEFKAIRIYKLDVKNDLQADVYTLGNGSWKTVGTAPDILESCLFYHWGYMKAFVNGAFHWLLVDMDDDLDQIITFDFETEQFGSIALPEIVEFEGYQILNLGVLGDSIYFCGHDKIESAESKEIWVMRQYGVVESWTKMFVIENEVGVQNPFIFRAIAVFDDGDVLLLWDKTLVWYDQETESYTLLSIEGRAIVHELRFALLKDDAKGDGLKVSRV
jgi:F-box interacting protein